MGRATAAARGDLHAFADALHAQFARGERCITAMGRCAAGLATIPVVVRHHPNACVVWFDAHGDSNLPSSSAVPYLGGMVITGAAGIGTAASARACRCPMCVLVGARDLDPHERQLIESGVLQVILPPGPRLAERLGARWASAMSTCTSIATCSSPGLVPIEYQVPGGLSFDDLRACATELAKRKIIGMEISEFESEWLDGRPGSPDRLIDAIAPLIQE